MTSTSKLIVLKKIQFYSVKSPITKNCLTFINEFISFSSGISSPPKYLFLKSIKRMVDATVDEESKLESFDSLQFPSLGLIFHIRRSLSFDLQ